MTAKYAMGITAAVAVVMSVLLLALYQRTGYSWIFLFPVAGYWAISARTLILQKRNTDEAVARLKSFAWPSSLVGVLAGLLVYALTHGVGDLGKLGYPQNH